MDAPLILSLLSAALMVTGHLIYIRSTLNGSTTPNKATWLIITFTGYVFVASQVASGVNNAIWGIAIPALSLTAVSIVSLKHGTSSVNRLDSIIVFIAMAGIVVWWLLENPRASIIATAATGALSVVPTINKLRTNPGSENTTNWAMAGISMIFILFAVEPEFDFMLVPSTWLVLNFTIAFLNSRGFNSSRT